MRNLYKTISQLYTFAFLYKFFILLHMIMSRTLISITLLLLCHLISMGSSWTGFCHITVNQGLPRNGVYAILPSSRGPVYIGTWDGLFVLNGTTVNEILFTPSSDSPVHTVNTLTEDSFGNIWVATSKGLMKFNPATGKCCSVTNSESHITSLYCDERNNIHFVENFKTYKILNQTDNSISSSDANGRIAGYNNLPAGTKSAFKTSGGHIFAATHSEVLLKTDTDSAFHKVFRSNVPVETITEYNGKILFGGNNGLTVYDPVTNKIEQIEINYSNPDGLNDRRITSMTVDYENGLWIGTFYGGINYLSPTAKNFNDYEELNSKLNGHVISGITCDSDGLIWFGIEDSGISSYNPTTGETKNFTTTSSNPNTYCPATSNIQTVFADGTTLYVGTAGKGMDVIDTKTMLHQRFQGAVKGANLPISIYSFARDKNGLIWIGTMSGLFTFNPETKRFSEISNIPKAIFHCLVTDSNGTVWAASQGAGLYSISPEGTIVHYQLPSNMIMSVCPQENAIYAGTEGDGLFIIDKVTGQVTPLPASLPNRLMVFTIIPDKKSIWFSTNKGLMHYSPVNNRLEHYTETDGLRSNQHKINSGLRLSDGQILMGSVSGIYKFNPEEIKHIDSRPLAYLTSIVHPYSHLESDSTILTANRVELPADANSVEFQFASSSNADPEKNRFEFMLEPVISKWQTTDNRNASASFSNLKPGSYTFRLRTTNGNGLYSPERCVNIIILPTNRMSTYAKWILFASVIIIICAIFAFIRHRKINREISVNIQDSRQTTAPDILVMTSPDAQFMEKLNNVIVQHIDNSSLTVDDLASYMAMGRSSFFAKVKELTNQTPNDYLRSVRLKHAAILLESSTMRINEVAYRVGFASPSYFARRFAASYGVSPAEYQIAAQKKKN